MEHKISQFADDTTLILNGSRASFGAALDTLAFYAKISGLKINDSKTKIIWIGSKKYSPDVYHHDRWKLTWGCTTFEMLGIEFCVNLAEMVTLNFDKQISKIRSLLQQWSRRLLTPIGRITVLKTIIIPKMNHLFISLPDPSNEFINRLNDMFYKFIWNNKIK